MKTWKLFFLFLTNAIFAPHAQACGWFPMPEDVRVSVFGPDLMSQMGYEPFFYTRHFLYDYDGGKRRDLFWEQNLTEWEGCLGHIVKRNEIDHFLSDIPYSDFDKASSYVFEKDFFRTTDLYRISPVARYLIDNEENEVLAYFFFAKAAERLVNPQNDPKSWKGFRINESAVKNLIAEMQATYKRVSDPLLKMRYAYQMVMLSRYIKEYSQCIRIYDEQLAPQPQSSQIRWLALLHKAAALARLDRLAEANLAFAEVFENCPGRRARAFLGFDAGKADSLSTPMLSPHDQTIMLAMQGLKNPGPILPLLQQIHALSPKHEMLNFLLIREINKLEDWVLTPRFSGYENGHIADYWENYGERRTEDYYALNRKKDLLYAEEVLKWVESVIQSGKMAENGIWILGAAHLALIREDFSGSQRWIRAFEGLKNPSFSLKEQAKLTALLSFVRLKGETDHQLLQRLYPLIQKIETHLNYERELRESPYFVSPLAKTYGHCMLGLAQRMEAEGKYDLAAIFIAKVNPQLHEDPWALHVPFFRKPAYMYGNINYMLHGFFNHYMYLEENASAATVEKLLIWAEKPNKAAWENYFLKQIIQTKDRLYFSLGRMYIREDRLSKARTAFQKVSPTSWQSDIYKEFWENDPFEHPLPLKPVKKAKEVHLPVQSLEQMMALQTQAAQSGPAQVTALEQLGNAYYNLSYHGNHWILTRCWKSMTEEGSYAPSGNEDFAAAYYGCSRAKAQYLKAFELSQDREQKARLLLLLARCEEHYFAWQNRDKKREESILPVGRNPYFKQLKSDFMPERAYIVNRCDRLKYYL